MSEEEKELRYKSLREDLRSLLKGETDHCAILANAAALIMERLDFFWVGFYLVKPKADFSENELVLGPFQGSSACFRIPFGKGVCGTAWKRQETLLAPDVEAFPGHIACSSLSRSEFVAPLFNKDHQVIAVLDIDSAEINAFDELDKRGLESIARMLEPFLYA